MESRSILDRGPAPAPAPAPAPIGSSRCKRLTCCSPYGVCFSELKRRLKAEKLAKEKAEKAEKAQNESCKASRNVASKNTTTEPKEEISPRVRNLTAIM